MPWKMLVLKVSVSLKTTVHWSGTFAVAFMDIINFKTTSWLATN